VAKKRGLDEGVLERARQAARLSFTLEPPTPEGRQNRNGEHRKERLKLMRADGLTHLKPIAKSPRYLHNLFKMAAVDHYWGPLAELAAALIEAGEPVPLRIRGIVVAKLRELSVEDSYKPEDPKKAKLYRDFTIGNAVSFVSHQTGLPPTRNDATTDAPSACSIVTEVLREFGP
jgi:hypothetical protein